MTSSKKTKRALLASVLSIILCVAMLIGTTFAWFTDSVTSSGNKIIAGNLNIDLVHVGGAADGKDVSIKTTPDHKIFNNDKWEPGYTQMETLKVLNNGNLALKFRLDVATVLATVDEQGNKLADVIDVYVYEGTGIPATKSFVEMTAANGWRNAGTLANLMADTDGVARGELLKEGDTAQMTVALHMQETAGNEYQGMTLGDLQFTLRATQYTYEKDGFDDQYDKNSEYSEYSVKIDSPDDLEKALAEYDTVVVTKDMQLPEQLDLSGDVTILGDGDGTTITAPKGGTRIIDSSNNEEDVTITLKNLNLEAADKERCLSFYGNDGEVDVVMDNCTATANKYALNVASENANVNVTIKNSTVTGWSAFQTHSAGTKATFENCTLIGNNTFTYNEAGWNNFATAVINQLAPNTELTFKNCRIEANQTTGNKQYFLSVRAENAKVNVENCTFFMDGKQISIDEVAKNVQVYPDALPTFKFTIK